MVASLADDGRLSLDEPVGRHAASLRLPGGNEHRATVADLLSHPLGLFAHAQDAKLEDGMDPRYLRGTLATLHNICAPGTCHAYQNVAYDAASEIVERVTGRPYGRSAARALLRAAGHDRRERQPGRADGRAELGAAAMSAAHPAGLEVTDTYYRVPAAGGVNGSIKDLAIWMLAQMGLAPDVLPPPVLAAVQAPRMRTPGENRRRAQVPRAHRDLRNMAWAGGSSIMPATASSAIMAACAAIAR